jgi:prophage antirepressor-like protein/phage anti-repressor protein
MDEGTKKTDGIPVKTVYRNGKEWVDVRSLHQKLGLKTPFLQWIKRRIKRFGLVEGKDYEILFERINRRGRRFRKYFFPPDIAEKLIVVERSIWNHETFSPITNFTFGERKLRVTSRNGELWFLRIDAYRILGIYGTHAVDDLEAEAHTIIYATNIGNSIFPVNHQILNEYGLYLLFFRSKTVVANEACKWLINEAMPQIRKAYAVPTPPSMLDRFRQFIKSLRKQPETAQAREGQNE